MFQWLLYIKIWWAWVGWHDEWLCNITSAQHYKKVADPWYSLLLLGYKPVQHVTVLNTVGN